MALGTVSQRVTLHTSAELSEWGGKREKEKGKRKEGWLDLKAGKNMSAENLR